MKRHVHTIDRVLGDPIKSLPEWLYTPMVIISLFGQPIVTGSIAMLIIGIGFGRSNDSLMLAGFIALITMVIGNILKLTLRRNRPITDYVEQMLFHTFSFPSGHAAGSVPTFGLVAYLLLPASTILAVSIAFLVFLIGVSRVYLGAHYASDVLGGWIVGVIGLAIIILVVGPSL